MVKKRDQVGQPLKILSIPGLEYSMLFYWLGN